MITAYVSNDFPKDIREDQCFTVFQSIPRSLAARWNEFLFLKIVPMTPHQQGKEQLRC